MDCNKIRAFHIPVGMLQQEGRFLLLAEPVLKDGNDLLRGLFIKAGIGIYKFHNTSKGPYPDPIDIVLNGVSCSFCGKASIFHMWTGILPAHGSTAWTQD